jgi:hypothetical protein
MCSVRIKQVNQIFTYINLKTNQSKIPCTYFNTRALYPLHNRSWKKLAHYVAIWNWVLCRWHQLYDLHVLIFVSSLWYIEIYVKKDMVSYTVGRNGKGFYLSLIFRSYCSIYRQDAKTLSMTSQQCITLWIGNLTKGKGFVFHWIYCMVPVNSLPSHRNTVFPGP